MVLFTLVAGFLPFEDPNTSALYKKILSGSYEKPDWLSDGEKSGRPSCTPSLWKRLGQGKRLSRVCCVASRACLDALQAQNRLARRKRERLL